MMIDKASILVLSIASFIGLAIASGSNSTQCLRLCGGERVNYPFGFSAGCEFRLNCTAAGKIEFNGFAIRNFSSDALLLKLPPNCSRPIDQIQQIYGKNSAVTLQNSLLLRNCSSPLNGCVVPASLLENRFGPECWRENGTRESMSCYTSETVRAGILRYDDIIATGCKFLYSSIVVEDSAGALEDYSDVSLDFRAIQVAWWLTGTCRCDENADCSTVGSDGYQCRCNEGFIGDGFSDGEGCRPVASSKVKHRETKVAVILGGLGAGVASMAVLAAICYCCHRRSTYLKSQLSARRLLSEAAGNSTVPLYPYREIEKATNSFCEKQRLGTGAYGTVYAGKLHNNECVAIKKIRHRDTESIEQVMNEIKLISSVSHPNLVRLLGCCIENGEQILVYEYMPNGTLSQHLTRERGKALPWTVRLTIATETAQAIAYLHSAMNPPIYHRDIKSSNILLDFNYKSKVADFGLSRLGMVETSHISTAPQGTPGYVDPQYHQNFHLSDKSDVYSYGVVLVEIITAMKVVDFSRPHSEVNLAALAVDRIGKGRLEEILDPFIELHRDAWTFSSVHKVAELAFRCLAYHRDMRPSMMEVAHELEVLRQSGWAPLDESIGMGSSVASSCSSPFNGSERSLGGLSAKKAVGSQRSLGGLSAKKAVGSQRLIVPQKVMDHLASLEEGKDSSPVSVHDPWFSKQSSPSTNSLLGNATQ